MKKKGSSKQPIEVIVKVEEVFNIIIDKNKKGKEIYRLQFKHNGQLMQNGMTNKKEDINRLGFNWIKKNPEHASSIVFEMHVLEAPTGLEPVLTD